MEHEAQWCDTCGRELHGRLSCPACSPSPEDECDEEGDEEEEAEEEDEEEEAEEEDQERDEEEDAEEEAEDLDTEPYEERIGDITIPDLD